MVISNHIEMGFASKFWKFLLVWKVVERVSKNSINPCKKWFWVFYFCCLGQQFPSVFKLFLSLTMAVVKQLLMVKFNDLVIIRKKKNFIFKQVKEFLRVFWKVIQECFTNNSTILKVYLLFF